MKTKLLTILFILFLPIAYSQEEKPDTALSLEQLLELVQQGKFAESEEATEREQKFARERSRQATLLANAKAERSRLEAIATQLEARFEANDAKLVVLEEQLKTRLGSLYETFGHLQGVASDTQQQFESAVTSGQFGQDREIFLKDLAKRMGEEIENSWYVNQYDNPSNPKAHYESTGPEIWDQTEGKVTHFVVGVGTGGTISGVGKFLKEKNPNVKIWGVDAYGSVLKKYHETGVFDKTEIYPYVTEGIGEDMIPKNIDFDIIDGFTKVTDKDAAVFCRELLKQEGMFLGNSAGAAIKGVLQLKDHFNPDDLVVVLFHDHGSRYLKKIYNDDWMQEMGYM